MTTQFHEMPPGYIGPPVLGHASSTVLDAGIGGITPFVPPPEPSFTRSAWVSIIAEAIRVAGCEFCNGTMWPAENNHYHACRKVGREMLNGKICHGECRCTCGRAKIAKSP